MLFNGSALIFTYSRTQVRIAEHERLQSYGNTIANFVSTYTFVGFSNFVDYNLVDFDHFVHFDRFDHWHLQAF